MIFKYSYTNNGIRKYLLAQSVQLINHVIIDVLEELRLDMILESTHGATSACVI